MVNPDLSPEQWERYERQLGAGVLAREDQTRLAQATVLVSRVGGMGGPAAQALVMAGVGRLIFAHGGALISPDLNRQTLGSEAGLGLPRAGQFAERLRSLNRFVAVEAVDHEPDDAEAFALAKRANLVISSAPTFVERLRLNAAAVAAGVPLVDAAQWGMAGTLIGVTPGRSACLRCVYPDDPPFEERFPVMGAISSAIGALAALEAIKILTGVGQNVLGRLWMIDGHQNRTSMMDLARRDDCSVCGRLFR